jgi:hypothetical protein
MAFVKLIEEDRADAAKLRIAEQTPREDPFGHESQARARTADVLKAHLIADGFAELFPKLAGHTARGHTDGQTAGFEDQDFAFDHRQ